MTHQLTGAGADALIASVGTRLDGSPLVVLLDIDGTLAPIAPRPELAAVPANTKDVLTRLARLSDVEIVFITGRSASDARHMLDIPGAWIIGNHGFELTAPDGETIASPDVQQFEPRVRDAERALEGMARATPGILLENKRWSLSVHFRLANPDSVPGVIERATDVARQMGMRVTDGKMIVELRPPVNIDKGTAAVALAERLKATSDAASLFNAGDDRTDEDAFRALRALNPRAVTVRVKGAGDDVAVPTDAEFVLATTEDLRAVLGWLAARRARATVA